jgi:hypothetical protein
MLGMTIRDLDAFQRAVSYIVERENGPAKGQG